MNDELKKDSETAANSVGEPAKKPETKRRWLPLAATLASLAGILFGALGYGVALSVDSEFGVPHTLLFSSSMDLLELSVWAFDRILVGTNEVLGHGDTYLVFLKMGLVVAAIVFLSWTALVFLDRWWRRKSSQSPNKSDDRVRKVFQTPSFNEETTKFLMIRGAVYGAVAGIGGSIGVVGALALLVLVCSFVAVVPMIGLSAGTAHIRDYVLTPDICIPLVDRPTRMARLAVKTKDVQTTKKVAANCVAVTKDDKTLGKGRVVFSTSEAIILFDPNTGAVNRVPTKDAVVQVVEKL
jgi:hypothetical protein